jgi:hypothetical protein
MATRKARPPAPGTDQKCLELVKRGRTEAERTVGMRRELPNYSFKMKKGEPCPAPTVHPESVEP